MEVTSSTEPASAPLHGPKGPRGGWFGACLRAAAASLGGAALTIGLNAPPAAAHHGWDEFDTAASYYMAGTLTEVHWGSPHIMVTLSVEEIALPDDLAGREVPDSYEEVGGREVLAAARPYAGSPGDELEIELAATEVQAQWGLDRPLRVGERIGLVGFAGHDHSGLYRADVLFLADGTASRQRLHVLQVFPTPAGEATASVAPSQDGSGTLDETAGTSRDADAGFPTALVWLLVVGGVLVVVAAGSFHLARQARRSND